MLERKYFELIWYKALAELNAEAARAYMGIFWWVMEPLLYMLAFYVAFGTGIRGGGERMLLFLLCGLVPWKWFASSVQNGSNAIQVNSGLIQQVYVPKYVLPWVVLIVNTIKFLIIFALLVILVVATGHKPGIVWLALPILILVQLLVTAGLTSFLAAFVPLLPDLKLVVDNGILVLMFLSGVFMDVSRLSPKLQLILEINPMVPVLNSYRNILLKGTWPDWGGMVWGLVFFIISYSIAKYVLKMYDRAYIKLMIN
ncbi:MAG: ABC transporter permease [Gammaproteobacteria bacterium]